MASQNLCALQYFCMEARGELDRLLPPGKCKGKLSWTNKLPKKFCEKFGVPLEEFEALDAAWQASRRVQQYRLLEGMERNGYKKKKKGAK
jgi:hypothetical protein